MEIQWDITQQFDKYFRIVVADTDEWRQQSYALRYEVYCREFAFLNGNQYPDKLESDEFDTHAAHVLVVHRVSGAVAGSARFIACEDDFYTALPCLRAGQSSLFDDYRNEWPYAPETLCEISRFCVHSNFRRKDRSKRTEVQSSPVEFSPEESKIFPFIVAALSLAMHVTRSYFQRPNGIAVVDPILPRLLARFGIPSHRISLDFPYHGTRALFYCEEAEVNESLRPELVPLRDLIAKLLRSHFSTAAPSPISPAKDQGSYRLETPSVQQQETDRLKRQADLVLNLERKLWKNLNITEHSAILDLACGPGFLTQAMANFHPTADYVGIDFDENMIRTAQSELAKSPCGNVRFHHDNVYKLHRIADSSVDFAYGRLVFQHLKFPFVALAQLRRVLKGNGTVCLIDVDDDWFTLHPAPNCLHQFLELSREGQRQMGGNRHIGRSLGAYLYSAGFHQIENQILTFSTPKDLSLWDFLDVSLGFRLELVPQESKEKAKGYLEEIYGVLKKPYALGAIGIYVVLAKNPRKVR